jgi:signal transduction histidine kinase
MSDRPSRRARRSLLLSGVLAAVGVAAVGVFVGLLGGGPPAAVIAGIAAGLLVLGVAAGSNAHARRTSTAVLVAASDFAGLAAAVCLGLLTVLLVLGRLPFGDERALVTPMMIGMMVVATLAGPLGRRSGRWTRSALQGVRRSPDELLADFAERAGREAPVEDLLRRLAEAMRRDWQLSRVEIWSQRDVAEHITKPGGAGSDVSGVLHRTTVVPVPLTDDDGEPARPPEPLQPNELAALRRVGVAGPAWLRLWLPRLLVGRPDLPGPVADRQLRLAPAVYAGRVLALVIVERAADADPFTGSDERALADVARRLAIVLRNRALDEALQTTLADLRRTNSDLQASRTRLVRTADAERRRIERDLHDGAQQHLVALAVGLRLFRDTVPESDPNLELLDELDRGIRESIASLRDLAHGIYPPLLRDAGLGEALRNAAKRSPLDVTVHDDGVGRHPEQVEAAVYFCCLEALQNAAKHAAGSAVTILLELRRGELRFEVADTGPGFDAARQAVGSGQQNMADRLGAIGGHVRWDSVPGHGTTVRGRVPVTTEAAVRVGG